MVKKKRQHYVPQFYLKNFTTDRTVFSILNVQSGMLVERVPCNRQCYASYFYQDQEIEDALGKLEATAAPIIMKALNQRVSQFTVVEEMTLKVFTIYQFFRTAGQCEHLIKLYGGLAAHFSKYYTTGEMPSSEIEDFIRKSKGKLLPQESLQIANKIVKLIDDLSLSVVTFSFKHSLISSDNPVIIFNNYYKQNVGFAMAGLIIAMPISTNKILVTYDSKMYNKDDSYGVRHESKYLDSLTLNNLQLYNANEIVYGADINIMNKMRLKLTAARKARRQKDSSIISALGPNGNEMVISQGPWPLISTDLSFLRLKPEAKTIPINGRDYFPRQGDFGWDQRLSILRNIPSIIEQTRLAKHKRNYQKHIKFVREYWGKE